MYEGAAPQCEDTMIFGKETQRRTPFHCAYNLQEIASGTLWLITLKWVQLRSQ